MSASPVAHTHPADVFDLPVAHTQPTHVFASPVAYTHQTRVIASPVAYTHQTRVFASPVAHTHPTHVFVVGLLVDAPFAGAELAALAPFALIHNRPEQLSPPAESLPTPDAPGLRCGFLPFPAFVANGV